MKKIIFFALLSIGLIASSTSETRAQSSLVNATGITIDTVNNTNTGTIFTPLRGYQASVTLQVDVTKISGTLGGTLIPVVSNDGTTFYPIPIINSSADSTKTITNVASQGYVFTMPTGYLYYGVRWTGTGTMSGSFKGTAIGRKP